MQRERERGKKWSRAREKKGGERERERREGRTLSSKIYFTRIVV